MHLSALFVCAAFAFQPALGEEKTIEEYDFAISLPADWTPKQMMPPALVKYEKGAQNVVLRVFDPPQPVTAKTFVEQLMAFYKDELPGHRVTRDEETSVSGYKGRMIVVEGKTKDAREIVEARVVVPRGMRRFYLVEAAGPAKEVDGVLAVLKAVVASMKIGLPLSKPDEEALARRPAFTVKASMVREEWARVMVQKRKLGWQRLAVREEKLDGAAAYGYESEVVLVFDDGRSTRRARGSFTPDGAVQTCEFELVMEDKAGKRQWRETCTLRSGEVTATREVEGVRSDARFRVPDGTFLAEPADVARRLLAQERKGSCAMRVLDTFTDEPRFDVIEIGSPERPMGASTDVVPILVKAGRRRYEHQYYEPDGTLWKIVPPGKGAYSVERCTKDEATK